MTETYISTDVEADGPIPGDNSMLSLASAAFAGIDSIEPIDTFSVNLYRIPGTGADPDTMAWWKKNAEAFDATRQNLQQPLKAMPNYVSWLKGLPGKLVFVGYPATYDFMFVYWYIKHFKLSCPFGFQGLDMKTLAMALMKSSFKGASKKNMPKEWFNGCGEHTHLALDDAIEQGVMFINMMRALKEQ